MSGTLPFADEYGPIEPQIKNGKYQFLAPCWKNASFESKKLISKMLKVNPQHRITINELLNSDWLSPSQKIIQDTKFSMDFEREISFEQQTNNINIIINDDQYEEEESTPNKRRKISYQ